MLEALAQDNDLTLTPNTENAGIHKSLAQEIGAGRGDADTPGSSLFIIRRDPFRSVRRGRQLFQRKFTADQGQGPRVNRSGAGNIEQNAALGAGLADSCATCHARPRGSAGAGGDVATRPDSRDTPHLFGLGLREMLADEITHDLRAIRSAAIVLAAATRAPATLPLRSKGIDFGSITASPSGTVDTSGVVGVNPDLRVRPFFADGREFSVRAFAAGAWNDEMGLQAFDPDLKAASSGGVVTTPGGLILDGTKDTIRGSPAASTDDDPDGDGVKNEIDVALLDHMEIYLLNYFKPATYQVTLATERGSALLQTIGCTSCHISDLRIEHDRRVADLETVYDPVHGVFNNLFATATPFVRQVDDGKGLPPLKVPALGGFVVKNIYTDFKRHDLGPNFHERNFDGTITTKFMTLALWGIGSTAPYGHDGRSINLTEVILRHGGEAQASRDAFAALPPLLRADVLEFLRSLVLFPPDDTTSNIGPADPTNPTFPQRGHGSIRLTTLFNDPTDQE
jgi:hypothetical protein